MSDITITKNNVSRFNKRLQQAINRELEIDIPLTQAAKLVAAMAGVQDIHEFQKVLNKTAVSRRVESIKNSEIEPIVKFVTEYFDSNTDTKIKDFSLITQDGFVAFSIRAESKKYPATMEGFSIFFGSAVGYIAKEQDQLILSEKDTRFISSLVDQLRFDDLPLNMYYGLRLKEYCGLNGNTNQNYRFHGNSKAIEIANYGFVIKQFALVQKDFFERVGAPFALDNDKYAFFDLTNTESIFFDSIEEALSANVLNDNTVLLEYLRPMSIKTKGALSSYYLWFEHGKIKASTVNCSQQQDIVSINDYYNFIGRVYFNLGYSLQYVQSLIEVNNDNREQILIGVQQCIQKVDKVRHVRII